MTGDVWTGTTKSGSAAISTRCGDWTDSAGVATRAGGASSNDDEWTDARLLACDVPARLYCFED